jgi:hypothetical protein
MRRILSIGTVIALAACGATLWPTTSVKVNGYVPDLYGCTAASARGLKYKLSVTDSGNGRFEARRPYTLAKEGPTVDEYDRNDVLMVTILKSVSDSGGPATLKIQAGTISTHGTKRGATEEPEYASPAVQQDAKTLLTRCGST